MKRILNMEIERCADCPYNIYMEFDDVGTSFGMDYVCSKGAGKKVESGGGFFVNVPLTEQQCNTTIRENCPLPKKEPLGGR